MSLVVIVGKDGIPHDVKVAKPVGKGLDEKAIDAVKGWRFRPGMWKGEPVATRIFVDITFSLYNSQILLDPPTSEEQSPTMVDG